MRFESLYFDTILCIFQYLHIEIYTVFPFSKQVRTQFIEFMKKKKIQKVSTPMLLQHMDFLRFYRIIPPYNAINKFVKYSALDSLKWCRTNEWVSMEQPIL
jgi:hypothetical protein